MKHKRRGVEDAPSSRRLLRTAEGLFSTSVTITFQGRGERKHNRRNDGATTTVPLRRARGAGILSFSSVTGIFRADRAAAPLPSPRPQVSVLFRHHQVCDPTIRGYLIRARMWVCGSSSSSHSSIVRRRRSSSSKRSSIGAAYTGDGSRGISHGAMMASDSPDW